jgi:uncharacterized surface protein with fasciclin (FAS1) repeats
LCSQENINRFGKLCELIRETYPVDNFLSNDGDFTLFAPINSAFDNLPEFDDDELRNILEYHVVVDTSIEFVDLTCDDSIDMLNREETKTTCDGDDTYQVGNGNGDISNIGEWPEISDENTEACNGIIHGISNVILPSSKTQ